MDGRLWFYVVGSERQGPIRVDQMHALHDAGTIGDDTLVWTDGMSNWAPLRETALYRGPHVPPLPPADSTAGADFGDERSAPPVSGFGDAISTCFRKYVTFSGRAARPEYWWFILFIILGGVAASIVDAAIFGSGHIDPLNGLFSLAVFLPNLAVTARRLHDTDRSGWWMLLALIPLVGLIILIVWLCGRGTPGRNRFG